MSTTTQPKYLTREEVLALLRIDAVTLWRWQKNLGFPYYKIMGVVLFLQGEIDYWMRERAYGIGRETDE